MQEESKKWIVLINRSPKGPLLRAEIQALIDEGMLRRNDLACLVHQDKSQKSDWKFLWQFEEFDRRNEKVIPTESKESERREPVFEDSIKVKINTLLPEEIASIRSEDLIFHSTSLSKEDSREEPTLSEEDLKLTDKNKSGSRPELVLGGIALLVVILFFIFKPKEKTAAKIAPTEANKVSLPLDQTKVVENRTPATNQRNMPTVVLKPKKVDTESVPAARDQGDIAYEEYRRKRDAEIEKERLKEQEEKTAQEEEEEEDSPKKKKKSKVKEAEETESEATEPAEESTTSDEPPEETPPEE